MIDATLSLLVLILLAPFLLYIAWKIKKGDGGPIFYRGERTGLNGVPFHIFKFRTMVVDAEKIGGASTADDDTRITPAGKFLRKYKLDELPQLINVFKGDMSIVGPRPEVKRYTDLFMGEEKDILSVRPGITDWASIWNADEGAVLAGAADPEKAYMDLIRPKKLKLQLAYVRHHSLMIDIKILYLTLLAIIRPGSGAVEEIRNREG